jgi:apolipoprotein N-acyltransferase
MRAKARAAMAASLLIKSLLAMVFGMALTMSFAPTGAWWFAPYCLTGLFLLLDTGGRVGFGIGACFGLGWFGSGFWWILPALATYSDAGLLFSFQLTGALVIYMSIFPACAAALIARCRRTAQPGLTGRLCTSTLIALAFAVSEWARGNLFGGFPMLATGYAHTQGALTGFAPLIGVYGLCFLNAWIAAWVATAIWQRRVGQVGRLWSETVIGIAIVAVSGIVLQQIDWSSKTGRTLAVSLLQGNLKQDEKFSDAGFARAVQTYLQMAASSGGRLTVLPETALPFEWSAMPPAVALAFQEIADKRDTTIVIGTVKYDSTTGSTRDSLTNSAIALFPAKAQEVSYRYDKHHLVPFAESLPPGTAWIGKRLGLEMNGLTPGRINQTALRTDDTNVGITICFEDLFDTAVAEKARYADVMLNLTNFAWFSGSYAPAQHLQVAQMRALETARWFVQVSNTGMTAIVDAKGIVRQELPQDQAGILDGRVQLLTGRTPFMIFGNWPLLLAASLAAIMAARGAPSLAQKLNRLTR